MGKSPEINTTRKVVPMIYSYTTPGVEYHDGWSKIGYTERDVETRVREQTHTAGIKYHIDWRGLAVYEDGSGDTFKDHHFHAYLRKRGIEQEQGENNEWFRTVLPESQRMFFEFKTNRGVVNTGPALEYQLRNEQEDAVRTTKVCFENDGNDEFLWNAKPRFGKTLSVYDLCKRLDAKNVLIVTNRPAVANSWYSDYSKFMGTESGYRFVSNVDGIRDKPNTVSRETFDRIRDGDPTAKCLEFVSLQDLKGAIPFGGQYDKLWYIKDEKWDLLVVDEAHEGVDTFKTDAAFDRIARKWTLHLSGTPFKALASGKFSDDAIFNWTYLDEQRAKAGFSDESEKENPYNDLPKLTMLTYRMSDIVTEVVSQGMLLGEDIVDFAFDLNEFFATKNGGSAFVHEVEVRRFLDALTNQDRFPFSTPDLRNELKHTLWLLDRVDSAKRLGKLLKEHPVFKDYEIIIAAGDGKLDADDVEGHIKSFDKVVKAIETCDKTITISVGQLTTGVTIPEWTAVMMLSNLRSPALYMQAAFRVQNPCLFNFGTEYYRKENAYVFDFDPARTLDIYERFANDLSASTSAGRGDTDTRKKHVRELLNFFPVLGEDPNGSMVELDAEQILLIPRKIRSQEVVRRGFMSNFLFQNIGRIFNAPAEAIDIICSLTPVEKEGELVPVPDLEVDEDGEVIIPEKLVIGTAEELFGNKVFGDPEEIEIAIREAEPTSRSAQEEAVRMIRQKFIEEAVNPALSIAQEKHSGELTRSTVKSIQSRLGSEIEMRAKKALNDIGISNRTLDAEKSKKLGECITEHDRQVVEEEYEERKRASYEEIHSSLRADIEEVRESVGTTIVQSILTRQKEKEKDDAEDVIRNHLRGFSRTIPLFLMGYGDESTKLENFDTLVPEDVFKEVTGITPDQFRFLRDGGDYEEDGEMKHFEGGLFDPVVFDDSIQEFLSLKRRLADWFDESQKGDIFDYIPNQKTNLVFTPRKVVEDMLDLLEKENPGCFDDENATFADLYMKSGQYIAGIVRRLYNSERLKELFPERINRLEHIFGEQVFGLAPAESIYRVACSYLFGFDEGLEIPKNHIQMMDSLESAKKGTLEKDVERLFGI